MREIAGNAVVKLACMLDDPQTIVNDYLKYYRETEMVDQLLPFSRSNMKGAISEAPQDHVAGFPISPRLSVTYQMLTGYLT